MLTQHISRSIQSQCHDDSQVDKSGSVQQPEKEETLIAFWCVFKYNMLHTLFDDINHKLVWFL